MSSVSEGVIVSLPPGALLDEAALAAALGVTDRTIRNMSRRGELPPPVKFAGRSTWLSDRIMARFEELAERAAENPTAAS